MYMVAEKATYSCRTAHANSIKSGASGYRIYSLDEILEEGTLNGEGAE